jgi:hypothetical protein
MALGSTGGSGWVPLPPPHAVDFNAFKQAGLAERLVGGKVFGGLAVGHVDDQHAAGTRCAVFRQHGATKDQNVRVVIEILKMSRTLCGTDGFAVRSVNSIATWPLSPVQVSVEHTTTLQHITSGYILAGHRDSEP